MKYIKQFVICKNGEYFIGSFGFIHIYIITGLHFNLKICFLVISDIELTLVVHVTYLKWNFITSLNLFLFYFVINNTYVYLIQFYYLFKFLLFLLVQVYKLTVFLTSVSCFTFYFRTFCTKCFILHICFIPQMKTNQVPIRGRYFYNLIIISDTISSFYVTKFSFYYFTLARLHFSITFACKHISFISFQHHLNFCCVKVKE